MPQDSAPQDVTMPIGLDYVQAVWASGTIDADTSFGTWLIGSTSVQITMSFLFEKIKDLEPNVHILQK